MGPVRGNRDAAKTVAAPSAAILIPTLDIWSGFEEESILFCPHESQKLPKCTYMRVVLNSFTRKRTSSPNIFFFCRTFAISIFNFSGTSGEYRTVNRTSNKWATVIFLWWLYIQIRCFCIVFWSLLTFIGQFWHFHAHTAVLTSRKEVLASPQFRPPSLQVKAVFRQGFSKTFAKLSRKINLYNKLEHFQIHRYIHKMPSALISWEEQKIQKLCVWGCHGLPSW